MRALIWTPGCYLSLVRLHTSGAETTCSDADSLPRCSTVFTHTAEDLSFVTKHKCPENAPGVQAHLRRRYSEAHRWLYLFLITTLVDPLAHPANSHRGRLHTKPRFWILHQALLDHDAVCLVCTCVVSYFMQCGWESIFSEALSVSTSAPGYC